MTPVEALVVPARFRGPAASGNGGWTAGALASLLEACPGDHAEPWPTVEVSLRMPPPLDVALPLEGTDDGLVATHQGRPVAQARAVRTVPTPVEPVDRATAVEATSEYRGRDRHPFPSCFSCGPERAEGDGLRIFPGRVPGDARVAAPWLPHPSLAEDWHAYGDDARRVAAPVTWASVDCAGGWAADIDDRPMVLARITARLDALPAIGEPHVVVGEVRGEEDRKVFTAATLYDADGRQVGTAEHLWVTVDLSRFG